MQSRKIEQEVKSGEMAATKHTLNIENKERTIETDHYKLSLIA